MGSVASSGGPVGIRCLTGAGGGVCVELRDRDLEASGAILSSPPSGVSGWRKKDRRSVEVPGGGCDVPWGLEERVVLDLPINLQWIVPEFAFYSAGLESRKIRHPSRSASGHAPIFICL